MKTVLVVDDSMFIRSRLRQALIAKGYAVEEAQNGLVALDKFAHSEFACVVTDLVMPEMDGFDFLTQLGENGNQVPVVVMTADIQHTTRSRCEALGARHFLNKPVSVQQVQDAVGEAIAAHG